MDSVQNMTWSTVSTGQSVIEMTELQNPQTLSENVNGQAEWGQLYFATAQVRFLLGTLRVGLKYICGAERCRHLWRRFCRLVNQYFL